MSRREPHEDSRVAADPCPTPPPPASHDDLRLGLMDAGRRVRAALDDVSDFAEARDALARFCHAELLPHLEADERWLLSAQACPEGRLLATAMRTEARAMAAAVNDLLATTSPCEAVAATRVLHTLLAAHDHHHQLLATAVRETARARPRAEA